MCFAALSAVLPSQQVTLAINPAFLSELCDVVIEDNCGAYPELSEKKDYIKKVIGMEEERFDATIDAGLSILSNLVRDAVKTVRIRFPAKMCLSCTIRSASRLT